MNFIRSIFTGIKNFFVGIKNFVLGLFGKSPEGEAPSDDGNSDGGSNGDKINEIVEGGVKSDTRDGAG